MYRVLGADCRVESEEDNVDSCGKVMVFRCRYTVIFAGAVTIRVAVAGTGANAN